MQLYPYVLCDVQRNSSTTRIPSCEKSEHCICCPHGVLRLTIMRFIEQVRFSRHVSSFSFSSGVTVKFNTSSLPYVMLAWISNKDENIRSFSVKVRSVLFHSHLMRASGRGNVTTILKQHK